MRVLAGNIRVGMSPSSLTSMNGTVHSVIIQSLVAAIAVPVTPDVPNQEFRAGALTALVTFTYSADIPDGLADLAWAAQRSSVTTGGRKRGELYFAATRYPGAAHATDNPEMGGWVLVEDVAVGGQGGAMDEHSVTWRGRDVQILT